MPFERYVDSAGKTRWRTYTKINDYLYGNIVPVRKVPLAKRRIYRKTLLQAARAARDCFTKFRVNSSFRTYEEQKALYAAYMNGHGNLAAVPGTSRHEKGNALDLSGAGGYPVGKTPSYARALQNRGFKFAVSGEAWHVELQR